MKTIAPQRYYLNTGHRDALGIMSKGKLAHNWTRTIRFDKKSELDRGANTVSLAFKPNEAIIESKVFKGLEWCMGHKEWEFGSSLESILFRDAALCRQFLLSTKILSAEIPKNLEIFAAGERVAYHEELLSNTLNWRYSFAGFEAIKDAISTYVNFLTIPQEFWSNIPKIISALKLARIGSLCVELPANKFIIAEQMLREIDSGFKPGEHYTGKLPDGLISQLMQQTVNLANL